MSDPTDVIPPPAHELKEELERLRLLHTISQEFNSSLELEELLPTVFHSVLNAVGAQGGSLWIREGEELRCQLALGASSQKLVGTTMPVGEGFVGDVARKQRTTIVTEAIRDPRFQQRVDRSSAMIATTIMATPMIAKGVTVGSIQVVNKVTGAGIFDDRDRELLEGLAASAAVALRNAQLHAAERRAHDLALLLEISREITATLDLDRVLQTVVNLAARAITFDRGAVALVDRGRWEVRAIAGQDTVDPRDPLATGFAERAAWAGSRGEPFYLPDLSAPAGEAAQAFASTSGESLREAEIRSVLYLPLQDEEGRLGVLLFESTKPEFITPTQRELAEILTNQTAVALRNAQLYHQVPMADTLGALARRKRALLALPRRRKQICAALAVVLAAALTLIQWPLRVPAREATVRAFPLTAVRAMVPGVLERVLVREGDTVAQGAPLAVLRNVGLEAERASRQAEAVTAERAAALAASRGDATEERLQRTRAEGLRQEAGLLGQEIDALTVRAPRPGVILTQRPEERTGLHLAAGDPVVTIGRTDTVTVEFGVDQRDLAYVRPGQAVRLRVEALPGRTFEGSVAFLGQLPADTTRGIVFPARATVANPGGLLRTGMAADARVLTSNMSLLGRVIRGPARWLRLTLWRMRP
ncbi:MAG: GAF domain-containing protein [Gemmatimonadales bacterium]